MGYRNVFGVPAKWACAANTNRVVQGSFKDFIDGLIYFVWSGFEINTAFTTVHHCFIPSYGILYEPAEEYHTSQHARTRLKCYCARSQFVQVDAEWDQYCVANINARSSDLRRAQFSKKSNMTALVSASSR